MILGVGVVNGPHLISTWTRVYLLPGERFKRPVRYWVIPGLAMAFAIVADADRRPSPCALVRSMIFYWATWHFVAQSWGVMRIYQRKHGAAERLEARLEKALIFLPAFFCALHRLFTGPWKLFGIEVIHVRPPALLVNGLGALIVALAAVYLIVWFAAGKQRPAHEWVRPAYLAFNFLGFAMPFLVIRDGNSAFGAAALWHAVQYIAIVWLFNDRRYRGGVDPNARLVSWVSQRGRPLAYMALIARLRRGRLHLRLRRVVLRPPAVHGHRAHLLDGLHAGALLPGRRHLEVAPLRPAHADHQRAGARRLTWPRAELDRSGASRPLRRRARSEKMRFSTPPRRSTLNYWKISFGCLAGLVLSVASCSHPGGGGTGTGSGGSNGTGGSGSCTPGTLGCPCNGTSCNQGLFCAATSAADRWRA